MLCKEDTKYIDHDNFLKACDKIVGKKHDDKGIGTYSEKSVHGVLKHYFEPDEDNHEVAVEGYFADILNADGVIEIQTRSFSRLKDKLSVFLQHYHVTVVYPLAVDTWVSRVNGNTGELLSRRKSPVHNTVYDAFYELYNVYECIGCDNFKVVLVFLDMEEYRLSSKSRKVGRKRTDKDDRIPIGIREILALERKEDYLQFVPFDLPEEFTKAEFQKAVGIDEYKAGITLNFLNKIGIIKQVGKRGRAYTYKALMQ